jgi:lipoyl(octanoyl) transferase
LGAQLNNVTSLSSPNIAWLGLAEYRQTFDAMRAHNRAMTESTPDEIWLLEHPPVFTLGLAGKPEHVLNAGDIPVVKIDRGGQVTYHGPGQLVAYLLLNLRNKRYGVKELVRRIEQSIIDLLQEYGVSAERRAGMPGVYVTPSLAKIAAIGLRVSNHATYHGLSLNVNMDTAPFSRINPCGYEGLATAQLADFGVRDNVASVGEKLARHLKANLYV